MQNGAYFSGLIQRDTGIDQDARSWWASTLETDPVRNLNRQYLYQWSLVAGRPGFDINPALWGADSMLHFTPTMTANRSGIVGDSAQNVARNIQLSPGLWE